MLRKKTVKKVVKKAAKKPPAMKGKKEKSAVSGEIFALKVRVKELEAEVTRWTKKAKAWRKRARGR